MLSILDRLFSRRRPENSSGIIQLPTDLLRDYRYASDEEVERSIWDVPAHKTDTLYLVYNSSLATTAAPVSQPTGTAIRTMLQLKLGAMNTSAQLVEWGCSFDGSAAATPGKVELFETTVAATMSTAYVNADIQLFNNNGGPANASNLPIDVTGTGTSGFATAAVTEGTVTNYRGFDLQLLPPTAPYVKQWPLGREPDWKAGNFLRCRMTFGASINAYIYVIFSV